MRTAEGYAGRLALALVIGFFAAWPAAGNDSPAAVAAGGIELRREPRIRMEEESLRICPDRVEVAYLFRNLSDSEVTTEVAFPIPPFSADFRGPGHWPVFGDFQARVEGKPVRYKTDIVATLDGEDRTALLLGLGLLSLSPSAIEQGFEALSPRERGVLVEAGLVEETPEELIPLWTLEVRYHWTQTFPPWHTLRVWHSYTPVRGSYAGALGSWPQKAREVEIRKTQPDRSTGSVWLPVGEDLRRWREERNGEGEGFQVSWVPYILVTGGNWRGSIGSFHLEVEHPPSMAAHVDFEGPIRRTSPTLLEGNLEWFVPRKDLVVYFFSTPFFPAH